VAVFGRLMHVLSVTVSQINVLAPQCQAVNAAAAAAVQMSCQVDGCVPLLTSVWNDHAL